MSNATRTEVGTCDLGNVFIFAVTSEDGKRWMVRAGNHTVGTYDTEARANAVAIALCGNDGVSNEFAATDSYAVNIPELAADVPAEMATYVKETRAKVAKK